MPHMLTLIDFLYITKSYNINLRMHSSFICKGNFLFFKDFINALENLNVFQATKNILNNALFLAISGYILIKS